MKSSASIVADDMIILNSGLFFITFFNNPNNKSVYAPLSCASSIYNQLPLNRDVRNQIDVRHTMITLYLLSKGSTIVSLNNIPSVIYFIRVLVGDDRSSNRIAYPTSSPSTVPTSSATRVATLVAATRLGWVQATTWLLPDQPASWRYCGISIYQLVPSSVVSETRLTRRLSASSLPNYDDNTILLNAPQQLLPMLIDRKPLSLGIKTQMSSIGVDGRK